MALRSGSPFAFIGVKAELLRQVSPDRVNRTNEWGGRVGKSGDGPARRECVEEHLKANLAYMGVPVNWPCV